ncbi:MAG TPA: polysaccharide biosynthesis/export family protein, partial [Blastocatellia bacterium]|nr:polysaccharide biosynthesis/export family protein [Blastocatellia bacterium]
MREGKPKTSFRLRAVAVTSLFILAAALPAVAARAFGQQAETKSAPAGRTMGSGQVLAASDEDYRIGVNDVIDIKVENAPELTGEYRVTSAGTFLMPYLGRIAAQHKTPEQLAQLISDGLRGDYLRDPKVVVKVKEFNSRSFFIHGSVRNPGVYQSEGNPSLLELITLASGLAENHGSTAFIIRRSKPPAPTPPQPINAPIPAAEAGAEGGDGPKYELKTVNVNALLKGQFNEDTYLEPGDIVNIPPADVFFVAGEVNQPGSFPLKDGTTVRQAIALAQGMKFNAASSRGIIFREGQSGKREELAVDIAAMMSGKKEDLVVRANDIIIVPNSRGKSVGGALLRAFGLST